MMVGMSEPERPRRIYPRDDGLGTRRGTLRMTDRWWGNYFRLVRLGLRP